MPIWIFNPFDDIPGEGPPLRYHSLAEALAARGHAVVWWSSDWSHRRKARRVSPLRGEKGAFDVRLIRTLPYARNISLRRVLSQRQWGNTLVQEAKEAVRLGELSRPDCIVASTPPLEGPMAALRLRESFGCRVVTDVMDAWPDTLLQAFPAGSRWLGRRLLQPYGRMLGRACTASDACAAQSVSFARYARKYGSKEEPFVCYLGAEGLPGDDRIGEDGESKVLRFLYLGSMGRSYDLETLIGATRHLLADGVPCELHLAGEGEKLSRLKERAGRFLGRGIEFHGFLSGEALAGLKSRCDVGIVPMFPASGVAVPYKAAEYLAAGLCVVNSLPGELRDMLEARHCGSFYEAGNQTSLAEEMGGYAGRNPEQRARGRKAARGLFEEKFDRRMIYPEYARWVEGGME